MSIAADVLQPRLVRGLIGLSGRLPPTRFADVITNAPGAGYDLDFDAVNNAIKIDFREPDFVAAAIGADASRFAAACFTSLHSIVNAVEKPETMAWALLRLYYAAFYGGHCILRLLGQSCSQVEASHITKLRSLAVALNNTPPFPMNGGLYRCALNSGQTGFSMTHINGRVGGTHEAFWEAFDSFLSEVANGALSGPVGQADGLSFFSKIEAVRRIYRRGAGASWLSMIRNEIQYRHARGVWAPPTVNKTNRDVLSRLAGQWTRDPMDVDIEVPPCGDLGAFISACAFTTALCRALLSRIAERSSVGPQSFARHPLRLC